jgi:hypothetical protein
MASSNRQSSSTLPTMTMTICSMPPHLSLQHLPLRVRRKAKRHSPQLQSKRLNLRPNPNLSKPSLLLLRFPRRRHPHRSSSNLNLPLPLSGLPLEPLLRPKSHPLWGHLLPQAYLKMHTVAIVPTVKTSHRVHLHPRLLSPNLPATARLSAQLHVRHQNLRCRPVVLISPFKPKPQPSPSRLSLRLQSPPPNPFPPDQHPLSLRLSTQPATSQLVQALSSAGLQVKPCLRETPGNARQIQTLGSSLSEMGIQSPLATLSTNGAAQLVPPAAAREVHLHL